MQTFIKHMLGAAGVFILAWGLAAPALADDFDDAMSAFDNLEDVEVQTTGAGPASRFRLSGYGKLSTVFTYDKPAPEAGQTDYRDLYRLRPELDIKLDADLFGSWELRAGGRFWHDCAYDINGRNFYTEDVLDEMENQTELWEAYVEGRLLPGLDLRLGRQIVVWGTSDNLRIVDVINPLDLREFGMVDIEGLRMPSAMVRADYTLGPWTFTGLAIPEIRPAKLPPFGGMYYPADEKLPEDHPPVDSIGNMEYGASITGRFTGWDASLYFADVHEDIPHLKMIQAPRMLVPPIFIPPATLIPPVSSDPVFERQYARLQMYGASTAVALGNWLIKAEAAYLEGLRFFNEPLVDKSRVDGLLGVEYSGFTDTTLSFDAAVRCLLNHEDSLEDFPDNTRETQPEFAFRAERDFRHDTFHLVLLATAYGEGAEDGWFVRTEAAYDWTEVLTTTLGVVGYGADEEGYYAYMKDNDCIFFDVKYSF